jgi:DNA polymerase I
MIYIITNQERLFNFQNSNIKLTSVENCLNYFKLEKEIQLDTETEGLDPHTKKLLTIQLGDSRGENQFVIDVSTVDINYFKPLLEDFNKLFILQNAKFDLKFFYKKKIIIKNVWDTFLAEGLINQGDKSKRKALDTLVNKYCNEYLDKSIRGDIQRLGLVESVIIYAAKDVLYLSEIKTKQLILLKEENLLKAIQLENLFVKVLAYIEYCGFKLDATLWQSKMKYDKLKLLKLKENLNNWILNSELTEYKNNQLDLFSNEAKVLIEWSSPKQVVKLFNKLGVNTKDKDGKSSVDAKIILPQKHLNSLLPIYLDYKAAEKVVSTYGESFIRQINKNTNRIHTQFTQLMDTGRLSCGGKDKSTNFESINFQNIPANPEFREEGVIYARDCFVPEQDYNFIVSDYSGQESVVFANKCLEPNLLAFYDNGYADMHSYVAKLCYPEILKDVPIEEVKKVRKDLRQNAKAAGFALQYGGVGATIANNLGITLEEGNAVEKAYYEAFPEIKNYFEKVTKEALSTGKVIINEITGHRVIFSFWGDYQQELTIIKKPGFWEEYKLHRENGTAEFINYYKPLIKSHFKKKGIMERVSKNYPIQGSSACITKLACIYIFNYLEERNLLFKVLIPNVIHDSPYNLSCLNPVNCWNILKNNKLQHNL